MINIDLKRIEIIPLGISDSSSGGGGGGTSTSTSFERATNMSWYLQPEELENIYFLKNVLENENGCLYVYGENYVTNREYEHPYSMNSGYYNYSIPFDDLYNLTLTYNFKKNDGNGGYILIERDAATLQGVVTNGNIDYYNYYNRNDEYISIPFDKQYDIYMWDSNNGEASHRNPDSGEYYYFLYKTVKNIPYCRKFSIYSSSESNLNNYVGVNLVLDDTKNINVTEIDDNTILIEQGNGNVYRQTRYSNEYINVFYNDKCYHNIQFKPSFLYNSNVIWRFPFLDKNNKRNVKVINPDFKLTNMDSFFSHNGISSLDLRDLDVSNVTSMNNMFNNCFSLEKIDFGNNFDTSNVTSMYEMFSGCSGLTSLDLSSLDTSNVTTMRYMFSYCSGLTSLDLSSFDTSNVTDMSSMFNRCGNLTSLDLSSFDTSNVTNMSSMFYMCSNLTSLDLSSFDTSNVTSIGFMFSWCSSLTELHWNNFGNGYEYNSISFSNSSKLGINTTDYPNARQSIVDTFVTNSFDREKKGYNFCTIQLHANTKAVLTEDEIAQITSKGFTIA